MITLVFIFVLGQQANQYDPLLVKKAAIIEKDLTVVDEKRKREIPVRLYLPAETSAAPVVLFSHGLGGSREGSTFLGKHWAARGYVAVFLQHPGSDAKVWKDAPLLERFGTLKSAANLKNLQLRFKDVPAVLDQLQKWNSEKEHPVFRRLDLEKVGMSGHSFGAVTTQAVAGQSTNFVNVTEPRIKAAVIMSPSGQKGSERNKKTFASVKVPWMLLTGTNDLAPIGGQTMEDRLAVYPSLPDIEKFELVLHEAEHSVFNDRGIRESKPNPKHRPVILAVTTAFWDSYLKNDPVAKQWLLGDGVKKLLDPKDRWQFNSKQK